MIIDQKPTPAGERETLELTPELVHRYLHDARFHSYVHHLRKATSPEEVLYILAALLPPPDGGRSECSGDGPR